MNIVERLLWWAAKIRSPSAEALGMPCRFSFLGAVGGRLDLYYDGSYLAPEGLQKGHGTDLSADHSLFQNRERPCFCGPPAGTDSAGD